MREVSPSITFSEVRNDLGSGYRAQELYGADTGNRSWSISLPTLTDDVVPTVTGLNGESVTREQYLWDLYCETRITGKPFAFTCPRDGQRYLADFVNPRLTYRKQFMVELYSTGIELEQVREPGETVFSPALMSSINRYNLDWFDQQGHSTNWNGNEGANSLTKNGTVTLGSNPQNGLNTVRLDGSSGYLTNNTGDWSTPIKEIWIVMKMRSSTFANNSGILTNTSGTPVLVGSSGTTKFQAPGITGFEYYLDGTQYATSDLQAPMNRFGIVQVRFTSSGMTAGVVQFGRNGSSSGTYAAVDIAEIVSSSGLIPYSDARQLHEYFSVKWGLNS